MWEQVTSSLRGFMHSPWLLLAGALLVLVPIIIHLLNKRKFKHVDWAAMDFLLEADRRNRRRIRLENLLLLLLRCLAVAIIGALLARPFIPSSFTAGFLNTSRFERVVLFDDSLSMQAREGNLSALDRAKKHLIGFLRELSASGNDETITLLVASRPEEPLLAARRVNRERLADLVAEVEQIGPCDLTLRLDEGLAQVHGELERRRPTSDQDINRVVYVISDMRARDWQSADGGPAGALAQIARLSEGVCLVNVGGSGQANLVVESMTPQQKTIAASVPTQFEVRVRNLGRSDVEDVAVDFFVKGENQGRKTLRRIRAGESAPVLFRHRFSDTDLPLDEGPMAAVHVPIWAEIAAPSSDVDRLPTDNVGYLAARIGRGVRALIINGEPPTGRDRSQASFLEAALSPFSNVDELSIDERRSGISTEVVSAAEMAEAPLDEYHVVLLYNVERVAPPVARRLQAFVNQGGGLVVFLGSQVDRDHYNQTLFAGGDGLLPMKLIGMRPESTGTQPISTGGEGRERWAGLSLSSPTHPLLEPFAKTGTAFLKFFQWWHSEVPHELTAGGDVRVAANFVLTGTDGEPLETKPSPAMIERRYGEGRVFVIASALSRDWSNWKEGQLSGRTFVSTMQKLAHYIAPGVQLAGTETVGRPLKYELDLKRFAAEVQLTFEKPDRSGEKPRMLAPPRVDPAATREKTIRPLSVDATRRSGFYRLKLTEHEGGAKEILFAANPVSTSQNPEQSESNLAPADVPRLQQELGGAGVQIIAADEPIPLGGDSAQVELWKLLLVLVVVILFTEQLLAWRFGRRR